ncbi:HEAT repeat domain-containing protein [Streptomyces sp. t39]|uniref:HEAT repeat domain-containing protein n=1 Tax=Streptomyces sp. t39 TaxID=1828156 RepID=UPI0011CD48DF|nr:HEAT repeat domain-containing protein [Streptomyces sp. t39]TXS54417.1 HEAT repeat domain-containing protein [Streptomyces sp. t39]
MTTDTNTPLSGLDAIDWSALEHAYGAAGDVPGQLRALCGQDPAERRRALHDLYGNIFHQGSRYEASAAAVPFLSRIARHAVLPDRAEVVGLLAALAVGYDEAHLPGGVNVSGRRREVADFRAKGEAGVRAEYDAWVREAADDGERRVREMHRAVLDFARDLRHLEDELATYDAVRAEVPALLSLLEDAEPDVRTAAAHAVAWFPEEAAGTVPHLLRLLERETEPAVTATALVAAGLLGDGTIVPVLRPFLGHERPSAVRWAAATAITEAGCPAQDADACVAVLATLCADEDEPSDHGIPFHEGDLRGYAAASLTVLGERHPGEALEAVTSGLSRTSGIAAFAVTSAALRLAFGDGRPASLPAYTDLTPAQQRLMRTLASLDDDTWMWGNFLEILRSWGVPAGREAMRAYTGTTGGQDG